MDLYEYQGKELFNRVWIPVSEGRLATTPEEARKAAEEIGAGHLDARAPEEGPPEVRRLARELNATAAKLQALLESQQAFVADASHELRTPVTAIRAAAETLLEGGIELSDQAREFVRMISRHAARLSRLTDDLLDLGGVERRRRQHTGGVAGMDACFLDVLHHGRDPGVLAVAQGVDVDLDGVLDEAVDEDRPRHGAHRLAQLGVVVADAHGTAAEHV